MKIRDMTTANPICCVPTDSAQRVARIMCDESVGSIPVVMDQESRRLVGVITDRDLCCSVVADGLDPKATNEFSEIVRQLSQDGRSVFMATHDLFNAVNVGSRIGIMRQGTLVYTLDAKDISAVDLQKLYLETI